MTHLSGSSIARHARTLAAALLLGTAILTFAPSETAHAARRVTTESSEIDSGGTGTGSGPGTVVIYAAKTKTGLQDAGYKCTYIASGFWECTKAGSPTYWCDAAGKCEVKPFRHPSDDIVNPGGGVYAPVEPVLHPSQDVTIPNNGGVKVTSTP